MYSKVIYLLYNGTHYDVFMKKDKEENEIGVFEVSDKQTKKEVLEIAKIFTKKFKELDKGNYKIKCDDCLSVFITEEELSNHNKTTGHKNNTLL